jgi:16S rRNA (guanine527-N7)-methyltransferase
VDPPPTDAALLAVLAAGQDRGMLGPATLDEQLRHSRAFVDLVAHGVRVADLGSGGGLPGLVIAHDRPDLRVTLIDASQGRADHLWRMVQRLDLDDRVEVEGRPAELVAHDPLHRAAYQAVTARGFGAPAVVAECAAGLLAPGGRLLVAEPPDDAADRWGPLAASPLPLHLVHRHLVDGVHLVELRLEGDCPARFPRAVGVPARRPLF